MRISTINLSTLLLNYMFIKSHKQIDGFIYETGIAYFFRTLMLYPGFFHFCGTHFLWSILNCYVSVYNSVFIFYSILVIKCHFEIRYIKFRNKYLFQKLYFRLQQSLKVHTHFLSIHIHMLVLFKHGYLFTLLNDLYAFF